MQLAPAPPNRATNVSATACTKMPAPAYPHHAPCPAHPCPARTGLDCRLPRDALERFWKGDANRILKDRALAGRRPHVNQYGASVAKANWLVNTKLLEEPSCPQRLGQPRHYLAHAPYVIHVGLMDLMWELWPKELREHAHVSHGSARDHRSL